MPKKYTPMKGEELFFNQILKKQERDFTNVKIEEGFNLSGHLDFEELNKYLKEQNLYDNPINISNSRFIAIKAIGLYLPFVIAIKADLSNADLSKAILYNANLSKAILYNADLSKANLSEAILFKADLSNAYLYKADLSEADICGAKNLSTTLNLDTIIRNHTKVTEKEKQIIDKAFSDIILYDIIE